MKATWMLLAEGLGQDARGSITAIGLNQNVFASRDFPAVTKRAVVLHFDDDRGEFVGGKVHVAFSVVSPTGVVIFSQSADIQLGERTFPDLPGQFDVPAEFAISLEGAGEYRIVADVRLPDGTTDSQEVSLFCVRQES